MQYQVSAGSYLVEEVSTKPTTGAFLNIHKIFGRHVSSSFTILFIEKSSPRLKKKTAVRWGKKTSTFRCDSVPVSNVPRSRFYEKKKKIKLVWRQFEQRFSSVSFAEALWALTTESVYNCLASEVFPVGTHRWTSSWPVPRTHWARDPPIPGLARDSPGVWLTMMSSAREASCLHKKNLN